MPLKPKLVAREAGKERVKKGGNQIAFYIGAGEKEYLQQALNLSPEIKLDGLHLCSQAKLSQTQACLECKFEEQSTVEGIDIGREKLFSSITVNFPGNFKDSALTVDPLKGEGRYRSTIHSSADDSSFIPLRYKTHKLSTETIPSVLLKSAILASLPREVLLPVKNQKIFLVALSLSEAGTISLLLSWNSNGNVIEAREILPGDLEAVTQKTKNIFVFNE